MSLNSHRKMLGFILIVFALGCSSSTDFLIPEKIGDKERTRLITGKQAARVINKMHGTSVAADANVIVEYGKDNRKDVLYITHYSDPKEAQKAFDLMIAKMTAAETSPFFHLMPLERYQKKVYITLGMGAVHYIYFSGNFLLWLQTFQSFNAVLPQQLLELFPL